MLAPNSTCVSPSRPSTSFLPRYPRSCTAKATHKALLDTACNLGIIRGNAAKLIPKNRRIPKGVKKAQGQPFISVDQFISLLGKIERPRDQIILKILFLCAVRRSELLVLKWKDLEQNDRMYTFTIQRSFCSRTHKIKEWNPALKAHGKVAVPPKLAADLEGWRKYGDTNGGDPEAFIFPTRNGTCIIPTNWAEDVLKPAGAKAEIPGVSYHWFRRGHATVQHHGGVADKPIQGQLRHSKAETTRNVYMQQVAPETWRTVVDLEKSVYGDGGPKTNPELQVRECGSNSVVESQPSKLLVAGSIPVSRSIFSSSYRL